MIKEQQIYDLSPEQSKVREGKGEYTILIPMQEQPPEGNGLESFRNGVANFGMIDNSNTSVVAVKIYCPFKINDKITVRQEWVSGLDPNDLKDQEDMPEILWESDTIISIEPKQVQDIGNEEFWPGFGQLFGHASAGVKKDMRVWWFNNKYGEGEYEKNIWVWVLGLKE